jgi:hypothetical protein
MTPVDRGGSVTDDEFLMKASAAALAFIPGDEKNFPGVTRRRASAARQE